MHHDYAHNVRLLPIHNKNNTCQQQHFYWLHKVSDKSQRRHRITFEIWLLRSYFIYHLCIVYLLFKRGLRLSPLSRSVHVISFVFVSFRLFPPRTSRCGHSSDLSRCSIYRAIERVLHAYPLPTYSYNNEKMHEYPKTLWKCDESVNNMDSLVHKRYCTHKLLDF